MPKRVSSKSPGSPGCACGEVEGGYLTSQVSVELCSLASGITHMRERRGGKTQRPLHQRIVPRSQTKKRCPVDCGADCSYPRSRQTSSPGRPDAADHEQQVDRIDQRGFQRLFAPGYRTVQRIDTEYAHCCAGTRKRLSRAAMRHVDPRIVTMTVKLTPPPPPAARSTPTTASAATHRARSPRRPTATWSAAHPRRSPSRPATRQSRYRD